MMNTSHEELVEAQKYFFHSLQQELYLLHSTFFPKDKKLNSLQAVLQVQLEIRTFYRMI